MAQTDVQAQPEQTHPQFELEQTDDYRQFLLHAKPEIVSVLRSLVQKRAIVTAYFNHGQSFLLTVLLAINPEKNEIIFDISNDKEMNRRALKAGKFIFTTAIDKVKIQFSLNKLSAEQYEGRPAFRAEIPESLLRLQRREYFRLSIPISNPVRCIISTLSADGRALSTTTHLLDISGGGAGLLVPPEQASLYERGVVLDNCKIMLPDEGLLAATLCVRDIFDVTTKSGHRYLRAGCEFVNLPGSRLTTIQRYITRVERERKARLSGMG
jgi:c-di-GMP-binding flagellar brake protein YcgR